MRYNVNSKAFFLHSPRSSLTIVPDIRSFMHADHKHYRSSYSSFIQVERTEAGTCYLFIL